MNPFFVTILSTKKSLQTKEVQMSGFGKTVLSIIVGVIAGVVVESIVGRFGVAVSAAVAVAMRAILISSD